MLIIRLLRNAFGKRNGHATFNPNEVIRIEGGMPTIVSKEDFEKVQEAFKVKMDELKKRKMDIEIKLLEIGAKDTKQIVTEADVKIF